MNEAKKCAHEACTCLVSSDSPYGAYCSEHCKAAADLTELTCECACPNATCTQP